MAFHHGGTMAQTAITTGVAPGQASIPPDVTIDKEDPGTVICFANLYSRSFFCRSFPFPLCGVVNVFEPFLFRVF
ncbi:hypothetical protein ACTG23_03540 [Aeromonas enteropelogenes]|uniref:hypothetical protein n=1 Tax=Aeromonas enteropelogenes TaxID=29489 RepID=UPI003B9F9DA0